jgi:hypothetical protein
MPIARQRLCKHIPEAYAFISKRTSIATYRTNNTHSWQKKTEFSVGSLPRGYKMAQSVVVQIRIEGVQQSSGGVQLEVIIKMTACRIVICELL